MEQGIKFTITGDTSGLDNASKKAESALDKLNRKIAKLEKDIADNIRITQGYENAIEELTREFKNGIISQDKYAKSLQRLQRDEKETRAETDRLRKELSKLKRDQKSLASVGGNTFKGVKTGAANAVPTLQEFSRVIQDAPYGIQGVGNNITQLVSQFGYLKKAAGGGKQALKALASSLAGPGGILFAISTVVSLLTVYGDELFASTNKAKQLEKQLDSLNESFGAQLNLNKEITRNLELQGKSVKNSLESRKEILRNQLRSLDTILKEQVAQLKLQQIQNQTTSDWEAFVLILQDALNSIRAFASVALQLSGVFLKDALKTAEGLKDTWIVDIVPGIKEAVLAAEALNKKLEEKKKQNKTSKDDLDKEKKLEQQINELLAQQLGIRNEILETNKKQAKTGSKSLATGLGLSFTPQIVSDPKEIAKSTRSYIEKAKKVLEKPSFGSLELPLNLDFDKKGIENINFPKLDEFLSGSDKQALSFPDLKDFKSGFTEYKSILSDFSSEDLAITNPFSDLKLEMPAVENEAFTSSLEEAFNRTKIFTDALGSAFSSLGGVISNALATGNAIVDAFVSSITNSLSSLLAEFVANQLAMAVLGKTQIAGEQAKANASGIVVATQGATAFGPLAPLALHGLLASTAATINAAFAPLYTFSQGGIVPGGSFVGDKVPILANGGERILTAQDQSLLTHVLRGGYAGTTNRGGGQTVEVVGRIRNEDIYLSNKRAAKKNRRIN